MRGMNVSRLSRRAFFGATASVAFAVALGPVPSRAGDQDSNQAEWPQSYETSPGMAVRRETTPILSPATVDATRRRSRNIRSLSPRAAGTPVPAVGELRVGSKGPGGRGSAPAAGRDRRPRSGRRARAESYDSFVEAGVERFQARNGLNRTGVVDKETLAGAQRQSPPRACSSSKRISSACAPIRATSASAS